MRFSRRFWARVDRSGDCWLWTGSRNAGYGQLRVRNGDGRRTHMRATHVAWELTNGAVPDGMQLLHRCDNPPCVRPDHLFLGTVADNHRDMVKKGRHTAGERSATARLTERGVVDIRERYAAGEPQRRLAAEYGVSQSAVSLVVNGRRWAA